jgi:hypothetical protein
VKALRAVRPTPSMVIASIALLVALAGTGYAAITLPRNSVGTAQLKNDAVITTKVKNHSLLRVDFAPNQIPAGPRGPAGAPGPPGAQGPKGATGPAGTAATKWALIGRDGNLVAGSSTSYTVIQTGPGQYYVNFGAPVTGHAIEVTGAFRNADLAFRGTAVVAICGNTASTSPPDTITCPFNNNTSTVFVSMTDTDNASQVNHAFYIAVI